jgi:hypothetical protein
MKPQGPVDCDPSQPNENEAALKLHHREAIQAMQARVEPYRPQDGSSVVDELIAERRAEAARE